MEDVGLFFSIEIHFTPSSFIYNFWQCIFNKFLEYITLFVHHFYPVWAELLTRMYVDRGAVISRSYFQCPHKWRPIARRLWLATACLLWIQTFIGILPQSLQRRMLYYMFYIWPRYNNNLLYLPSHNFYMYKYTSFMAVSYNRICINSRVTHSWMLFVKLTTCLLIVLAPSQYKDRLSRYEDSHVKYKTVARPSYL